MGCRMSFKDRSFLQRMNAMGDQSEGAFEQWCEDTDTKYIRWGLDRPPLSLRLLPTRIRYSPDYLTSHNFVECQGFGTDQTFKLKVEKHGALHWWADLHPVDFWILDSHKQRACLLSLADFDQHLAMGTELRSFPEGKAYFAVNGDAIFESAGTRVYATNA